MKVPLRLALMFVLQLLVAFAPRQQVSSFQTKAPFLTRGLCHHSGFTRPLPHQDFHHPFHPQERGMPRSHTQELGMILNFDFGDAMASAAAVAGMAIAASIVTKELAAAKGTPGTMTELAFQSNTNNSSFQPKPPKVTPPLKLMSRGVDVQPQQQQLPPVVVDDKIAPAVIVASSSTTTAQQEDALVVPTSIVGIPYVSDSLVDNVQDELVVVEEEIERLIVDPLVLDDVESDTILPVDNVQDELVVMDEELERLTVDPVVFDDVESDSVLDNPLLYEGGYYEDEEEELFGVYERVEILDDPQEDQLLDAFETSQVDEKDEELSVGTLEGNRPIVVSYLDTLQRNEPPVPYLESLTSNSVVATDLQPVSTYLDGLSDLKVEEQQQRLPEALDSITGVPYVSDSLVDAVQDGLVAFEDEERVTVDPLALSRMDDEESLVEIDDRGATMMVTTQSDTPIDEATQDVEKFQSVLASTDDSEGGFVDEVEAANTISNNNDELQSTYIVEPLQEADNMFKEQAVAQDEEAPRPQLKLSKSFPTPEQPPLPSPPVPFVDPKLDAVRKHLQVKAINMTKALLKKTEQAVPAPPPSTDFEDATKQLDTEQGDRTETTKPVLSLEKEPTVDKEIKILVKEAKPLLNLEKGVEKTKSSNKKPLLNLSKDESSTSTKPVLSLEKGSSSNNKGSQRGILGVLRKQKVPIAVATLAVVAVKRLVQAIIRRGMF